MSQSKDPRRAQRRADRALCPIRVAQSAGLKVHVVARAMRHAGVTEPLTVRQAKAWQSMREEPPEWFVALMVRKAARQATRAARTRARDLEYEHRWVILSADVEARLLAGRRVRGYERETIAADFAFQAMKDLVRADGDTAYLGELDLAALRWVGVDPDNRDTWLLGSGGDT